MQPNAHGLVENVEKIVRQCFRVGRTCSWLELQRPIRFLRYATGTNLHVTSGLDLLNRRKGARPGNSEAEQSRGNRGVIEAAGHPRVGQQSFDFGGEQSRVVSHAIIDWLDPKSIPHEVKRPSFGVEKCERKLATQ